MKANHATIPVFLAAVLLLTTDSFSQTQNAAPANLNSSPSATDYACIQRAPHSKVWQRSVIQTNFDGSVSTNFQSYTELASGLCYVDPTSGQYVDSVEQIDLTATGAQAIRGAHQVQWAANINTAGGSVQLTTPDGKTFNSRVFGLCYWDSSTGTNVLIGGLQDANGSVVGSNQVLYANAFTNVNADISYTYTKAGLEQNVILREQLPSPSDYGLNPDSTYLNVLTEFFSPPDPLSVSSPQTSAVTDDWIISFGSMYIGVGNAFLMGTGNGSSVAGPVAKQWTTLQGRNFLIEEVPYSMISSLETNLPLHAVLSKPSKRISRMAALQIPPPKQKSSQLPMKVAKSSPECPGFVIDYAMVSSGTNLTFQSDTTYYVSGNITLYGTNTFEGDTVIKYAPGVGMAAVPTPITLQLNFLTGPYRPVVFTAQDDDSAGMPLTGISTGNPWGNYYANPALSVSGASATLTQLRVSFAQQAFSFAGTTAIVRDAQFVNCSNGVTGAGMTVTLENALMASVIAPFNGLSAGNTVIAENVTFGSNQCLLAFGNTNYINTAFSASFTNCIFGQVTNLGGYLGLSPFTNYTPAGDYNGFYISPFFGGSHSQTNRTFPFQSQGAGNYYLAPSSPFSEQGTESIDPALLAELQNLTLYPPAVISGVITGSTNLSPYVERDNIWPSMGFHYCPLDFALNLDASYGTITIEADTAIAMFGNQYGIFLDTNEIIECAGTATIPNYIVRYNTVQEQSNTNWETTGWLSAVRGPQYSDSSSANFAYTKWSTLADGSYHIYNYFVPCPFSLQCCELYGGQVYAINGTISSSNSLYQRVELILKDSTTGIADTFYNSLFYNGSFTFRHGGSSPWTFRDNLFDSVVISNLNGANIDICSHNAYVTNFLTLTPENHDVTLTNSPAYETGPLGIYYYPTNSPLVTNGSQLASAGGLALFTVTTNNTPDGTNLVSIGYHYFDVAMPPELSISTSPGLTWISESKYILTFDVTNSVPAYPVTFGWQTNGAAIVDGYSYYSLYNLTPTTEGTVSVNITNAYGTTNLTWYVHLANPGMVEAWGDDDSGECDRPGTLTNCSGIAAGEYQSIAVTDGGAVLQWGDYSDGSSYYSVTNTSVATQPPSNGIIAVAGGLGQGLGLTTSNTIVAWGLSAAYGTSVPSQLNLTNVKAIACGWQFDVALRNDGIVTAWGLNDPSIGYTMTNVPPGLFNVTAIAAGPLHTLALLSNGTVVAWGYDPDGETNVPAGLSNVVAVAAGESHNLALKSDGTVVAWGLNDDGQTNVPAGLSNVMAIAAGDNHSVALLNDGTLVEWGDNSSGQASVPSVPASTTIYATPGYPANIGAAILVKLIAAGGDHTMAAIWSPMVQYPIDVSKDLLLIYNTNSTNNGSSNVCAYYLANRPMVATCTNVIALGCTNYEIIEPNAFTNTILIPIENWLTSNPTKRPWYIILFQDIPSRVDYPPYTPSVQTELNSTLPWSPLITSINMSGTGGTNDCIGYINKLAFFGSNYSPVQLFISASAGGYSNTNWYFDDNTTNPDYELYPYALEAFEGVTNSGISASYIDYQPFTSSIIITNCTNAAGYFSWGCNGSFGTNYEFPIDDALTFSGASGWCLLTTTESYNGEIYQTFESSFLEWYATNAFGGTNYSNTPVGVICHVDEPRASGAGNMNQFFGLWAAGKPFAVCAWAGWATPQFQAVGDPWTKR